MNATMGLVEAAVCVVTSEDCPDALREDAEEFLRASWRREIPWAIPRREIEASGAGLVGEGVEVKQ